MTPEDADRVLAPLVAMTPGWTDDSVTVWHQSVTQCTDVTAAHHATKVTIEEHDGHSRPLWSMWIGVYRARAERPQSVTAAITARPCSLRDAITAWRERNAPADQQLLAIIDRIRPTP